MSEPIDRAAEVIATSHTAEGAAENLDTAGLLVTPARDAAVATRAAENALRDAQAIIKARTDHMARYDTPSPYMQALNDAWGLIANRLREVEREGGSDA